MKPVRRSLCLLVVLVLLSSTTEAQINTLASFNGDNGKSPASPLILLGSTLYGTASFGGANDDGTFFSLPTTGGEITTLATFNWENGANPYGSFVLSGNTFYGSAVRGGVFGYGTVWGVSISGGDIASISSFNGGNGANPLGGLTLLGNTMYGNTRYGGASGDGTIFSISTLPVWSIQLLNSFNGTDGENSQSGLTMMPAGNGYTYFYGTTPSGGTYGRGTAFSFLIGPSGGFSAITTLASFNVTDGSPNSSVIVSGNTLYGTTFNLGGGGGTVFSLPLDGGAITTLATFTGGTNGGFPSGCGLTLVGNTLYGTTDAGGAYNDGTLFSVSTNGGDLTTLASFGGTNANPAFLIASSSNTLYGTTTQGGAYGDGTVFSYQIVPEPSTYALLVLGAFVTLMLLRRKNAG